MDIFLVRHGEAAASWGQSKDPGLSKLGQQQARDAADLLKPQLGTIVELISSPLVRAQETATPLAQALQLDVSISDLYREIPSPVPLEQRQDWLRSFMQQTWDEQGEELHRWRREAHDSLLGLEPSAEKSVVVFTHFLVINTVAGQVLGREQTCHFYPDNGSITRLRHTGANLEMVSLGQELTTFVN